MLLSARQKTIQMTNRKKTICRTASMTWATTKMSLTLMTDGNPGPLMRLVRS